MLTCKDIARLVSDDLDRKLPLRQKMRVRLHLMMCGACSTYRRQVAQLHQLFCQRFREPTDADEAPAELRCPEDAKKRMTRWLSQRLS